MLLHLLKNVYILNNFQLKKINANYLINFVNNKLNDRDTYYENIVEVTNKGSLGGEYITGDDGTKLQITQGDNKVIVTYTLK